MFMWESLYITFLCLYLTFLPEKAEEIKYFILKHWKELLLRINITCEASNTDWSSVLFFKKSKEKLRELGTDEERELQSNQEVYISFKRIFNTYLVKVYAELWNTQVTTV